MRVRAEFILNIPDNLVKQCLDREDPINWEVTKEAFDKVFNMFADSVDFASTSEDYEEIVDNTCIKDYQFRDEHGNVMFEM